MDTPASMDVDVAIVGGGMVGASCALALSGCGRRVALIEGVPLESGRQPSFDERTTALGNASRRIFEALGVWAQMQPEAQAITTIHVSEAGHFGVARLEASEQGIDAFGYVVPNRVIGAALWRALMQADDLVLRVPAQVREIRFAPEGARLALHSAPQGTEELHAQLVVGADGAQSLVRAAAGIEAGTEDYGQAAVVTSVASDEPHGGRAFERFTATGPIALLPLAHERLAVVWARTPESADALLKCGEGPFLEELQRAFGWRAGRFSALGHRGSYPLALTRASATSAPRTVLIGNAAQALHPVAGQGFNLGLRDAAMLAEVLAGSAGDAGDPSLLARFAQLRGGDRAGVTRFTDSLVKLFGDRRPGVALLRNLGLLAFDLSPTAKRELARVGSGFAGPVPRLARGLRLPRP